jgi:hypothetical protein
MDHSPDRHQDFSSTDLCLHGLSFRWRASAMSFRWIKAQIAPPSLAFAAGASGAMVAVLDRRYYMEML